MATVTTTALWPQPDQYTGNPAVCTGQATAVPAAMLSVDGYQPDSSYAKPTPRLNTALGPQAARWLFPLATTIPAASPFTRYPTGP